MDSDEKAFSGLPMSEAAPKPEPVVAFTVTMNLGDQRQIQLAGHFNRDSDEAEQSAIVDRVLRQGDRQKAKYDLDQHEANFRTVGATLRNLLVSIPGAETALKLELAKLNIRLKTQEEARKEIYNEGYDQHTKSGRRGDYEPKGGILSRLNVVDGEIAKTKMAIEAAPKDADQERQKVFQSILKYQEDLRERRLKINELRKLAGLEPMTEFMEEECQALPEAAKG